MAEKIELPESIRLLNAKLVANVFAHYEILAESKNQSSCKMTQHQHEDDGSFVVQKEMDGASLPVLPVPPRTQNIHDQERMEIFETVSPSVRRGHEQSSGSQVNTNGLYLVKVSGTLPGSNDTSPAEPPDSHLSSISSASPKADNARELAALRNEIAALERQVAELQREKEIERLRAADGVHCLQDGDDGECFCLLLLNQKTASSHSCLPSPQVRKGWKDNC